MLETVQLLLKCIQFKPVNYFHRYLGGTLRLKLGRFGRFLVSWRKLGKKCKFMFTICRNDDIEIELIWALFYEGAGTRVKNRHAMSEEDNNSLPLYPNVNRLLPYSKADRLLSRKQTFLPSFSISVRYARSRTATSTSKADSLHFSALEIVILIWKTIGRGEDVSVIVVESFR